jgi:transcriptional regulator
VPASELLQGTLDLLILKILSRGPDHGWNIGHHIQQFSREGLKTSQGSLYPALHRLELAGDIRSDMAVSENNRRARVYRLTAAGQRRLKDDEARWEHFVRSMKRVLRTC